MHRTTGASVRQSAPISSHHPVKEPRGERHGRRCGKLTTLPEVDRVARLRKIQNQLRAGRLRNVLESLTLCLTSSTTEPEVSETVDSGDDAVRHELEAFLEQDQVEIAAEYKRIYRRSTEDPGTAGDQGEENWADLLRQWLPPRRPRAASSSPIKPQVNKSTFWCCVERIRLVC